MILHKIMASTEEELAERLQRSQSTPEPLFGQPDLELNSKISNSHRHQQLNGNTLKEGKAKSESFYLIDLFINILFGIF